MKRFVYMSSCSVYGVADGVVDESSPVDPQTIYAECKALVERDVLPMADDGFSPTFLRNATAFGASPRMRFDIVLNNLAGLAWTTEEDRDDKRRHAVASAGPRARHRQGDPDDARRRPAKPCTAQVFNVGSDEQNYRVREIAEVIGEVFPGCDVSFGPPAADNRSYKVNFDRIREVLPGYECDWNARQGAEQLLAVFASIDLDEATFAGRGFTRLKQLEYLIRTGQVDDELFWRQP